MFSTLFRNQPKDGAVPAIMNNEHDEEVIRAGTLVIRPTRVAVSVAGESVDLTAMEMAILCLLARRPGMVFSREQILDAVHHDGSEVSRRAVNTRVQELRKKLGEAGGDLKAVRGVGYMFDAEPVADPEETEDQEGWGSPRWMLGIGGLWASLKSARASAGVGLASAIGIASFGVWGLGGGGLPWNSSAVSYLATISVPGDARDASGLNETLEDGRPHDRLGGFGSGLAWTGKGQQYVAVTDRGPSEYWVDATPRVQVFDLIEQALVDSGHSDGTGAEGWEGGRHGTAEHGYGFVLRRTHLLTDENNRRYTGNASALPQAVHRMGRRLDAEGIAVIPGKDDKSPGSWIVAEEYGPSLLRFSSSGRWIESLRLPDAFQISRPAVMRDDERRLNRVGPLRDRSLCGVAWVPTPRASADAENNISGHGTIWTVTSSPLIQDGAKDGHFLRLLGLPVAGGGAGAISQQEETALQFVYELDNPQYWVTDLLGVDHDTLLVMEIELSEGRYISQRKIYRVDIAGATDVSGMMALPSKDLPPGVVAVQKTLLLDLLDPNLPLPDAVSQARFEGMTWGPPLEDGRRLLVVTTDNGFHPDEASQLFLFAVPDKALR